MHNFWTDEAGGLPIWAALALILGIMVSCASHETELHALTLEESLGPEVRVETL